MKWASTSSERLAAGLMCALLGPLCGASAQADMVVQRWAVGQEAAHPTTIRILETKAGKGVIQVDLSALPKGSRVYRARLFVERKAVDPNGPEALVANEVYPLTAPLEGGGPLRVTAKPLPIAPPRYDCFDALDAVAASAGGSCELLVKSLPAWVPEGTCLEVAYEGKSKAVPTQATGVAVFHRAGQTFITWKEVQPLVTAQETTWGEIRKKLIQPKGAFSYRIYAHSGPINAGTIAQTELLARVGPLSGYNCNGRNMEYLIGQAMLQPDEMGELARDYNGYMYTWGMDHPRMDRYPVRRFVIDEKAGALPPGTGLYVHHPAAPGNRYYAVVSCREGVENTADFSVANALAKPVTETVGPGQPVRQGEGLWGPYFDYPGRRQVYVQWTAPPLSPQPNMYFNWSVLVPPARPGTTSPQKAPAEICLHSGNFSYAKPRKKHILNSIQIAPHDYPFSGWYGFNSAFGTLKSWTDGVVSNHTQRRFVAFLAWAKKAFPLDEDRIVLPGSDGAAMLALNYRELFAYVLIDAFGGGGKVQGRVLDPREARRFASAWGPKDADIKDEAGRANWGWAMLDRLARERPGDDLPLFTCAGTSWGGKRFYGSGHGPFYDAMQQEGQPVIAGHGWNKKLIPPDYYTGRWGPRRHAPATKPIDLTGKTPIPAFANSSGTHMSLQSGNVNFDHTWEDVTDRPEMFQITLRGQGKVDMTLRRVQQFKVTPGERLRWRADPVLSRRDTKEDYPPQGGIVAADKHGRLRVQKLKIPGDKLIVTVTREK